MSVNVGMMVKIEEKGLVNHIEKILNLQNTKIV